MSTRSRLSVGLLLCLLPAGGLLPACGPKAPPASTVDHRSQPPAPLAQRPFQLPVAHRGTLSNGLAVVVVENHEVPLVHISLALRPGSWADPIDRPGLADVTMDMLNEGAGGRSAAELSAAARRLGSSLGSSAGLDGALVSASGLRATLPETLDLMTTILLHPDFPEEDWQILKKKRLQALAEARKDPRSIASRVWSRLGYGARYAGHLVTEESYEAMRTAEMEAWYRSFVVPGNAMILVGGDTSLAEVQPLLEARLGGWTATGAELPPLPLAEELPVQSETRVYLVDKPGATQSIVRVGRFAGGRLDPDRPAFDLANMAVGGMFTARINMNLREDKGWTYGANSWTEDGYLPSRWQAGASVVSASTADAVKEILRELDESRSSRPISQQELDNGRGYLLGTLPVRYENPGTLMAETVAMWRYDLPEDWITGAPDRLRAVTLEAAQAAWDSRVQTGQLTILVVGDAATVKEPLVALGYPLFMMDAEGVVVRD